MANQLPTKSNEGRAMMFKKKMAVLLGTLALGVTVAVPSVSANPFHPDHPLPDAKAKCNSGDGNSSETDPANDCDPGNSGGRNNGGD